MDVVDFTPADVDTTIATACSAAAILRSTSPLQRGEMLRSGADALEAAGAELIELGRRETNYVEARMRSELARTCYQLRFFAGVVEEGSFVDATIDHVDPDWALGARPDIRRQMVPLGPVVVFAAGNFPFAFSVAGGETASAIAAGCPVVLKVHPDHPMLSVRTGELFDAGLRDAGAPAGTIGLIHGVDAGRQALLDPRITAVAFTGSTGGGRALYDLARSRPVPIPFFGELGSINPTFVTPAATRARGAEIINGYVSSFTLGVGQFCTKPGLLFLPSDHGLTAEAVAAVERVAPVNMTAARIRDNHREGVALLQNRPGVRTLVDGAVDEGGVSPTLLVTTAADVIADPSGVLDECFGPSSIIVECDDWGQTCAAAELVPGALTSTVHAEPSDVHLVRPLLDVLQQRSGRVIWNDWPTGVAVTWAMVHGGPYPSSTSAMYTSVGSAAMARFLRPVCYQNFPADLLPPSVAEHNPWTIPQRVDGTLTISHDDIASRI